MKQQKQHTIFELKAISAFSKDQRLLRDINLTIQANEILALVGPDRSIKLLLLRMLNRMSDLDKNFSWSGELLFEKKPIQNIKIEHLRRQVGLLVERPNIFPTSIYENIAFGLRLTQKKKDKEIKFIVQKVLEKVDLWERCYPILHRSASILNRAEQQRLCLARILALDPKVILMERPTASLVSSEAAKFEQLIVSLKKNYTIVVVTQSRQQAGRISTQTAFFYNGQLIEKSPTSQLFTQPSVELTESYITGRLD